MEVRAEVRLLGLAGSQSWEDEDPEAGSFGRPVTSGWAALWPWSPAGHSVQDSGCSLGGGEPGSTRDSQQAAP